MTNSKTDTYRVKLKKPAWCVKKKQKKKKKRKIGTRRKRKEMRRAEDPNTHKDREREQEIPTMVTQLTPTESNQHRYH